MKRLLLQVVVLTFIGTYAIGQVNSAEKAPLGDPPYMAPLELKERVGAAQALATVGLSVNTDDRAAVVNFYKTIYLPALNVSADWNGNTAQCNAGATSDAYTNATLQIVNFFRAMTRLPGNTTFVSTYNAKSQQAALMMRANCALSHFPPTSWDCYSSAGAEAARNSNLAGQPGPEAIIAYMDDYGTSNYFVGHRRWILYPPQIQMGVGSNAEAGICGIYYFSGANALWVLAPFGSRPATPAWVAWPPAGYVPYPLIFERWSLSYNNSSGADFSQATVTMNGPNGVIPVTKEPLNNGYGDNTLVWKPSALQLSSGMLDMLVSVNVSNIKVASSTVNFAYEVRIFDADQSPSIFPSIFDDGFENP